MSASARSLSCQFQLTGEADPILPTHTDNGLINNPPGDRREGCLFNRKGEEDEYADHIFLLIIIHEKYWF
jgi:hypothetical protein